MSEPTKTEVIKAFALMCNSGLVKMEVDFVAKGMARFRKYRLLSFSGNYEVAYLEQTAFGFGKDAQVGELMVESVGRCQLNDNEFTDVELTLCKVKSDQLREMKEAAEKTARGILSRAREIQNKAVDHASKEESRTEPGEIIDDKRSGSIAFPDDWPTE